MVELAVTVDAGMRFVQATYNLEGDGPLALTCYETISVLNAAARQAYSNLRAVTSETSSGNSLIEIDLVQHELLTLFSMNFCPTRPQLLLSAVISYIA